MSWELKKAVTRIFNVLKRSKEKVYDQDVEALKLISEFIEASAKESVNSNILYAKMLCFFLQRQTMNYDSIQIAIKEADNELRKPLAVHIKELQYAMNKVEEMKALNKMKNAQDFLNVNIETWDYKKVETSFYNTANQFLNDKDKQQ